MECIGRVSSIALLQHNHEFEADDDDDEDDEDEDEDDFVCVSLHWLCGLPQQLQS